MIISIEGDEATGKTTFAYTAPKPIVGFSFDMGTERALFGSKFNELFKGLSINLVSYSEGYPPLVQWDGYDITVYELPPPIQLDTAHVSGAREQWDYFLGLVGKALRDHQVRTLVVDTMTLARRVRVSAHLQDLQRDGGKPGAAPRRSLIQIEYGVPNDAIRDIYSSTKGVKKNLAAIHHLTDEYKEQFVTDRKTGETRVESAATGKRILEGLNNTYRFVDVSLRMSKSGQEIKGLMQKFGYDLSLSGLELDNPTWDSIVNLVNIVTEERIRF